MSTTVHTPTDYATHLKSERWRMPSGQVAVIDLTDPPAAVQGARETLWMNGATLIEPAPCPVYSWCDGHTPTFPSSCGSHMRLIHVEGSTEAIIAFRHLPASELDEPAHWSFSMPVDTEWNVGPADLDAEIDDQVAFLERARGEIKLFLQRHSSED